MTRSEKKTLAAREANERHARLADIRARLVSLITRPGYSALIFGSSINPATVVVRRGDGSGSVYDFQCPIAIRCLIVDGMSSAPILFDEIDRLREDRSRLLAALQSVLPFAEALLEGGEHAEYQANRDAVTEARAAIAQALGTDG